MLWALYAVMTAFLKSGATLVRKEALFKEHAMELSSVLALFNVILSIPFFFLIDYSRITIEPLIILFFVAIFAATAYYFISKGVRHMEVSAASPILVMAPGISAIFALIFLGEKLTTIQILGIVLLIAGAYTLELKSHHSLFEPFKIFKKSRFIHFILIGLLCYGATSVFDRFILTRYDFQPLAYLAFAHIFIAFHLFLMSSIFHKGATDIKHGIKNAGWWILLLSAITVAGRYFQFKAIKIAFVGLVLSIKRSSSFLTTLIGGELFHEKNLLRKSIACVILIAGAILIIL